MKNVTHVLPPRKEKLFTLRVDASDRALLRIAARLTRQTESAFVRDAITKAISEIASTHSNRREEGK